MKDIDYYLVIDIEHLVVDILGSVENEKINLEETYRFEDGISKVGN